MENQDKKAKELGAVFQVEVEVSENDIAKGYLRKPTRNQMSAALALSQDPIRSDEVLLKACLIKEVSDERLITNDDCFMAVRMQLSKLIEIKQASIKKL
ncbi:MAG: hypothetical protein COZ16_05570 [Flavobacteriaceae bacterium CG_4_10_14_3_um_filter_31_253]|nr:MAG: hypothetical protein COZ16_05570 [Flavobacteriaceae bacterium CG_4_10_14_3_um_filter_31_253]